jgi:hypothetical protein
MSLLNRYSALVTVVALTTGTSVVSAAPMFRAPMFRPAAPPMFRGGRVHHGRFIPIHPPLNNYTGPPLPPPCPPGQFRQYFPAIQGWMCAPLAPYMGPRF